MKLHSLQQLVDYQGVQPARSLGSTGESRSMQPLSKAEESMIQEKFPAASAKPFQVYLRSGMSRMESQISKGTQIDFRV
ncbi:MAG TPA: hypothetical protein VKA08_09965 [Balneolales bacterium]|nr:hypothetical protein [Balneolales bacterium]